MTPTPRTDERANSWESTDGQWVNAEFARQLERENQTFRAAQKACEDCDAPRVDRIAELERELAAASDQLAANHEATRLMGKWLEQERALADRLAGVLLSYDHDMLAGEDMQWLPEHDKSLAAWKEARRGTV